MNASAVNESNIFRMLMLTFLNQVSMVIDRAGVHCTLHCTGGSNDSAPRVISCER